MKTITIQVKDELAEYVSNISDAEKNEFAQYLERQLINFRLTKIMDKVGGQAQANGLTPEILQQLLLDEPEV